LVHNPGSRKPEPEIRPYGMGRMVWVICFEAYGCECRLSAVPVHQPRQCYLPQQGLLMWGSGFRLEAVELSIPYSGVRVQERVFFWFRVQGSGFRVQNVGLRI